MSETNLPLHNILNGDCVQILNTFPEKTIDLIFADPPYNLQLHQELWRPNMSRVHGVNDEWDHFENFKAYDEFTLEWLTACKRVLKDTGTLWVIGTYHNIFRIGKILQDLGFWVLNDVVWIKSNPMPNFRGVRFTNAHETLIWASKHKGAKYTFNHHAMKEFNNGKQMRSDWWLPTCIGKERLKTNGKKAHNTQKPEALLYRIILSSTNPGDIVLDPFFGTGTTGAVAKKLHRRWIGIERKAEYVKLAKERINNIQAAPFDETLFDVSDRKRRAPRVAFVKLIENNYISPGQYLYFLGDRKKAARVKPDGKLVFKNQEGSIHQLGKLISNSISCNGWHCWSYEDENGNLHKIDELREAYRRNELNTK